MAFDNVIEGWLGGAGCQKGGAAGAVLVLGQRQALEADDQVEGVGPVGPLQGVAGVEAAGDGAIALCDATAQRHHDRSAFLGIGQVHSTKHFPAIQLIGCGRCVIRVE